MPFQKKGGGAALLLRIKPGKSKNATIRFYQEGGYIFPDSWDDILVEEDATGQYLILPEDAESLHSKNKATAAKLPTQKQAVTEDEYNAHVKQSTDRFEAERRIKRYQGDRRDFKTRYQRPQTTMNTEDRASSTEETPSEPPEV